MASPTWLSRRSGRFHRAAVCLLAGGIAFASCTVDRTPELIGTWQATMLIEEGDTIEVILDDVGLYFDMDGSYIYTSTLDYEEAGTFRTRGDMLFTTPSMQDTLIERPVAIALLNDQSLHLNMKEGKKNRILEFERVSDSEASELLKEVHDHDHLDHNHMDELQQGDSIRLDTGFVDEIED